MGILSHLSSSSKHTPKEWIAQANAELENARRENNPKKALDLLQDAKSKIQKAEKSFSSARAKEPSLDDGIPSDIANAYHEHGELLDKLGYSKMAQESHNKAQKWGYVRVASGHTPTLEHGDSGSSNQSSSNLSPLTVTPSSVIIDRQISDSKMFQSPTGTLVQETTTIKVEKVISTPTGPISHISSNIFERDVSPPTPKDTLSNMTGHVTNVQQLVHCLNLLTTSSEELESNELEWIQKAREDPDEKIQLEDMTTDLIRAFARDELKSCDDVDEVVWLAPVLDQYYFRKLLQLIIDGINHSTLLQVDMVDGLVRMMRNAGTRPIDSGDLVKILDLLTSRLNSTHDQSSQQIYNLTLAVSAVLDSMADNNVTGLSREQLHGPLFEYLECLKDRPEPYLMYQAAYTFQALQYVPDDESRINAVQRNAVNLLQGVIGVATGAKGMDIGSVIEGLKKIRDTATEVAKPFIFNMKANVESGQSLMNNLKEGFRFKRDWYPALRAIDVSLRSGRLSDVKQLINQAPSYRDPAFQLGLCQRLGELAINPFWDMNARQDAIDLLIEIYKNDTIWGQHEGVKKWILHILCQLKDSSDVTISEKARALLQDLKTNIDTKNQNTYAEYEKESSSSYPLMIALPPKTCRLFQQMNSRPGLSATLTKLRSERLKEGREELYIAPRAKRSLNAKDEFDLRTNLQEFLTSDKKVFLILGDSGSGKSTFNRAVEIELWEKYKKMDKVIPLFIHLPSIENPDKDLVVKKLRDLHFTEEHIQELRQDYEFVLICDGYDETQLTKNLYNSNKLNQAEGWRAQMVISCRTEYNGVDYKDRFQPLDRNTIGDSELFQEAVIVPFNKDQIQDYIEQYVSMSNSTETKWDSQDYERALKQIPTLQDLVRNPFLLRITMLVLPRLFDSNKDFSSEKVTRIALYDEFIDLWLVRSRKRLEELKKEPEQARLFDKLCDSGFTKRGVAYIRDLSKAIYMNNKGKPVFTYPNERGQDSWEATFFSEQIGNHFLHQSIPLVRSNDQYRFIHKSIQEYGLTLSIFDPTTIHQIEEQAPTQSRRGSTSSALSFEMEDAEEHTVTPKEQPLIESPFGKKSFIDEPSIIQFLVERVQQQPIFKEQLHAAIERSKTDTKARTAAANAITVLVRAGVQFNGSDLRGIKIPGADLSFGVFDSAQLQGVDLRKTNLRNVWLRRANLEGARMDGIQFGELPFLQEDDEVCCCAYSPDGNILALGLKNGIISFYETSNWKRTQRLTGHEREVTSLSFSTTNNRIASGSSDKTVRLWDIDTGECVHTLQGHSHYVRSVVYSLKGDRIASGSSDSTIRLWDVGTGECVLTLQGHSDWVRSVVYSPKGDRIASGSDDSTVRVWDVDTGECVYTLQGHSRFVNSVVYSPKGDRIASGSEDKSVRLWDVGTGECVRILQGHSGAVTSVVYSPKRGRIASGSDDLTVRVWDVDAGECLQILQGHSSKAISVVYSPKGDQIASGSSDCRARVWDVDTGEGVHVLQGHSFHVTSVVHSPKGDRIVSGSEDKTVRVWDVGTGECVHILQGHSGAVTSVVYLPKGDRIASGSQDMTVRLWDADTSECVHILQGHSNWVTSVVHSPKGDRIASGSDDSTVRLWDVDTGECVHVLQGHSSKVRSVVYSPKGDRLASGSEDETLRLWDVDTGECVHILQGHSDYVRSVVYSPNGNRIASGSDDMTVRLWDSDTGECICTLQGHSDYIRSVVYSPNGDRIASGSNDKTVRMWDVELGECVHISQGHSGYVNIVVYSPNGDLIASGSSDNTVRLWDTETNQCGAPISDFHGSVTSFALKSGSDSLFLVTGSEDKSVRLWKIVKQGDKHKSTLCWSSSHEVLTVTEASFNDALGLSQLNQKLLAQRGALVPAILPTEK
ncbi:hypothetical protein BGZ46_001183 [Entomortierella lignicola]|nr:hypothetical protein BGZ46_001183 [Entomortierella lignicola]